MFRLERPASEEQFATYYDLRWRELRAPWDQPRGSERDDLEDVADHVTAHDEQGRLVGVGRLHMNDPSEAQIRYMAVEADCRGLGVGRAIVERLELLAHEHGAEKIVLNARDEVVGFYEKLGFCLVGAGPTMFGEVGHSKMEKLLEIG